MSTAEIIRRPSQVSSRSVDYVGFSNFPNQVFRRCIKNGFEFTLMVVGQSGLGKSTFLNTLFLAEINDFKVPEEIPATVKIESKTVRLVENDVRLTITFADTPGFGDLVDNSNCWDSITKYIDSKFSEYLNEETKIDRAQTINDHRVHLCLYFIAPTGHGLKPLDVEFLRALQDRVNIVPVIAKADTLTTHELEQFKKNIISDLQKNHIRLYEFPEPEQNTPDPSRLPNGGGLSAHHHSNTSDYRKRVPFAVVGSNHLKEVDRNRKVRVREYSWGTVEVENLAHNDFIALRDMIIRNNLIDLIDMTKIVHYENFRVRQMSKNPKDALDCDPFTQLEKERKACEEEAEEKRNVKERLFKEKLAFRETALQKKAANLDIMEKENNKLLEEKRAIYERLKQELNDLKRVNLTDSSISLNRSSPPEKSKKKIGLFSRNN